MVPVLDNINKLAGSSLEKSSHWVRFFLRNPRKKVRLVRWGNGEPQTHPALEYFSQNGTLPPGGIGLLTYSGFIGDPAGWFYRDLEQKRFDQWLTGRPSFYVTQGFEDNLGMFQRSSPVFVTEGLLDAEALVSVTGYPYVVAQMGSSLSWAQLQAIGLLTEDVVLVPDSDKAGEGGSRKTKAALIRLGLRCRVLCQNSAKDVVALYDSGDTVGLRKLKMSVESLL